MTFPFDSNHYRVEQIIRGRSSSNGLSTFRTATHDHILPVGWFCKFDPKTKRYYFIRESDDENSSSSSSSSDEWQDEDEYGELQPSPDKKSMRRIRATSEEQANIDRICRQFPNVDRSYITHLSRIYRNRENLVISALLAQNYSRQPVTGIMVDEALFYKIRQSFPHIEPEYIRKLLIQNENREHPTIEALLNLFGLFNTTRYKHSKRPQLKLKYLKFAFPDIDEIELLDLLFKNEFDAGRVIKYLKLNGHEHSEHIEIRMSKLSETVLLKEANERLQASRPKSLIFQEKYHPNLWEQEDIRKNLIEMYPSVDIFLVNRALEATRFDIKLASSFLDTMTPQDAEKYLQRILLDRIEPKRLIRVSRHVQTNSLTQDLFGRLVIVEIFDHDDDDQEFEKQDQKMEDKSTCTKEDGIIIRKTFKLAHGPNKENQKGPDANNRITKRSERLGPINVRIGTDFQMRQGPQDQLRADQRAMKIGAQKKNRQGAIGRQVIRWKEQMQEMMNDVDESIYFFPDSKNEKNDNQYIVCND